MYAAQLSVPATRPETLMTVRYYKATDGLLTVFRATTRVYASAWFTTETGQGRPPFLRRSPGIGFSTHAPGGRGGNYPAVEITEAEYAALVAAKIERAKNEGRDPKYFASLQENWVHNRALAS
jgi:hypothetical protein